MTDFEWYIFIEFLPFFPLFSILQVFYNNHTYYCKHTIPCIKFPCTWKIPTGYIWVQLFIFLLTYNQASLVTQLVKNPPAKWETWVWSLGWEDPLEKGMANYSNIIAWRIPQTEEPVELQSMELQRVGLDWATNTFTFQVSKSKDLNLF